MECSRLNFQLDSLQTEKFKIFFQQEKDKLSVRSKNILNKILYQDKYSKYLFKILMDGINFTHIRNAGKKTQIELNDFFEKLKDALVENHYEIKKDKSLIYEKAYIDLSEFNKYKFKNLIKELRATLSVRSNNILNTLLVYEDETQNLLVLMTDNTIEFLSLKNSGKKVAKELTQFIIKLRVFFADINTTASEENLTLERIKLLFNFTPSPIYIENNELSENPFDYFFDIVSNSNYLKANESKIFNLYIKKNLEINEISKNIDVSYERVRQILVGVLPKKLFNIINLIIDEFDLEFLITSKLNEDCFCFSEDEMTDYIQDSLFKELGVKFYSEYFIYYLNKRGFYLINPSKDLLKGCGNAHFRYEDYRKRRKTNNYWLIKSSLIEKKELIKSLTTINLKITSRNKFDYILSWNSLFTVVNSDKSNFMISFLKREYNIYSNSIGISVYRNTKMTLDEYIYVALEELDRMSLIDEIMNKLDELFPDKHKGFVADSIRNTITRYKDLFIYERRQISLYGLKKWEDEKFVKGGTIRELVIEYILSQKRPCHISEIADYVLQFRKNSSLKSILWNLELETKDRFAFYKGSMIGLSETFKNGSINSLEEISLDQLIGGLFDYD